jgi:protoheme IX farnesyltransferase
MTDVAYQNAREEAYLAGPRDFFALLKPRVMVLVVFTAVIGMMLAPGAIHPVIAFTAILCISIAAGAAGAINMWYDRDIDAIMTRTVGRPIPSGRVAPNEALTFGVVLAGGSVLVMDLAVGHVAAAMLAGSIGFYVFIYTMWLKRRTAQNIVIGGLAGAFPPMIGWASVTGGVEWTSLSLVLIIFLWTPPHFWALALYRSQDYARAGVPMLPVTAGDRETKRQIVLYTIALVASSFIPQALGALGWVYGGAAALLGGIFFWMAIAVSRSDSDKPARRLFGYSILYLFILFAMMPIDRLVYGLL